MGSSDCVLVFIISFDLVIGLGWVALQFLSLIQGARWLPKTCNQDLALYCLISGAFPFVLTILSLLYSWLISLDIPRYSLPKWRAELNRIYNKKYRNSYGARRLAPYYTPSASKLDLTDEESDSDSTHSSLQSKSISYFPKLYSAPNCSSEPWLGPKSGKNAEKLSLYQLNGLYSQIPYGIWDDHPVVVTLIVIVGILCIASCLAVVGWLIYGTYLVSKTSTTQCYEPLYRLALSTVVINWSAPVVAVIVSALALVCFL